jgi:hypothetical protein
MVALLLGAVSVSDGSCDSRGHRGSTKSTTSWKRGCDLSSGSQKCSISAMVNSRTRSSFSRGEISLRNARPMVVAANGS